MVLAREAGWKGAWDLGDEERGKGGDHENPENEAYKGHRYLDANDIPLFLALGTPPHFVLGNGNEGCTP